MDREHHQHPNAPGAATATAPDPAPAHPHTPTPARPASPPPSPYPPNSPPPHRVWPWLLTLLLIAAIATDVYYRWSTDNKATAAAAATAHGQHTTASAAHAGRGGFANRAIPVAAATATRGNLDLYIDGLGTVTAYNVVTVRSRVDGQLVNIAYTEGQHVNQGDLLAEIDPRPFQAALEQAQGQLARDQAQLTNAQLDLQRYQQAGTAVTKQQLDTQAALVRQDQGIVQTDTAAVDNARLQLSYCRITSPITGRVGLRPVDVGNMIHATDTDGLAVVTQLQPISVVFSIPQASLPDVLRQVYAAKPLTVAALDGDFHTIATGKLAAIDNQVDVTNGMVRLKATFDNKDDVLFPNQYVNARLYYQSLQGVTLTPAAAVQRGPDNSTFAYVVKPDDTVEMRPITVSLTQGDQAVIKSGLQPGDQVVTDGVDKLIEGSKVTLSHPTTNPTAKVANRSPNPTTTTTHAHHRTAATPQTTDN